MDWTTYLRCPYCFAGPGRPCMTRTTAKYIEKPHPERERVEQPFGHPELDGARAFPTGVA